MQFTIRFANSPARSFTAWLLPLLTLFMFPACEPLDSKAKEWTEFLREKAEAGDAAAQYSLAEMYWDGDGVPDDHVEAARWYREAAEQGYVEAQRMVGFMYDLGVGVPENHVEAAKWYQKAAEQGHADVQSSLGFLCERGKGVPQDYVEAAKWYRKAAEQGHAGAQSSLGGAYRNGEGVLKNGVEAAKWYRKAAERGHVDAQVRLSLMYREGDGVAKDEVEADKWTQEVANRERFAEAKRTQTALDHADALTQRNLGEAYYNGRGPKSDIEAAKWFQKAAEQGYAGAQWFLGLMYVKGAGVPKSDVEAIKWFRKAADQGFADAQFNLGRMYYEGAGVPKDDKEAVKWMRTVAEQGYTGAQWLIGLMYVNSREFNDMDIPPPPLDAFWLLHNIQDIQDALENDIEPGARQVVEQANASMYDDVAGVPKNDMEAYAWVLLAKGLGIEEADKVIELLEKRLTAAQQIEGQARAAELDRTIPRL